jgi:hypothetical protein
MPSNVSRRTLLTAVSAGAATALAGCGGSESSDPPTDAGTLVTDHVVATTRSPGEDPPIVAPREGVDGGVTTDDASAADPIGHHRVGSRSGADAFEFAEDATNVAAARRLLAETDYDSESVLVFQERIGECYRLQVDYVARDGDGDPDIQFCSVIRDARTACERGAFDHVATFVRLPFPDDEYGGFSIGFGSDCGPIPDSYRNGSDSA